MSIVQGITDWSKEVILPLGAPGLFLMSFAESTFFPIPPDIILALMCLFAVDPSYGGTPGNPICLFYGLVTVAGSVVGAFVGYYIGLKGGRPILKKFSKEKEGPVQRYFDKYGDWAVGIAGFTPIPYKIFTIAGGVFKVDLKKFFIASTLSRSARFMGESVLIMFYGPVMYDFVNDDLRFGLVTLVLSVFIILFAWYRVKKRRLEESAPSKEIDKESSSEVHDGEGHNDVPPSSDDSKDGEQEDDDDSPSDQPGDVSPSIEEEDQVEEVKESSLENDIGGGQTGDDSLTQDQKL